MHQFAREGHECPRLQRAQFDSDLQNALVNLRTAKIQLLSLMNDTQTQVLATMQWMGECPAPWRINSEIGTLADEMPPGGKMFRFLRYDVRLEKDWLARELNYPVSDELLAKLRGMDDPKVVQELYEIGRLAAAKQVKIEHLVR